MIRAIWQRYQLLGLPLPDVIYDGLSFKDDRQEWFDTLAAKNGYDEVSPLLVTLVEQVGARFVTSNGEPVSLTLQVPDYPDACQYLLDQIKLLRHRREELFSYSGVLKTCQTARPGTRLYSWKLPNQYSCKPLVSLVLRDTIADQGRLSIVGAPGSAHVSYTLGDPANAFYRLISKITSVGSDDAPISAIAPDQFRNFAEVPKGDLVVFTPDETFEQQLLVPRLYLAPVEALQEWQDQQPSSASDESFWIEQGGSQTTGLRIHPPTAKVGKLIFFTLDEARTPSDSFDVATLARTGEPADLSGPLSQLPTGNLGFFYTGAEGLTFDDFTNPGYAGRPYNDLNLYEVVWSQSNAATLEAHGKVYTKAGSLPWAVPSAEMVSFKVDGITDEFDASTDVAQSDKPATADNPQLLIRERFPAPGSSVTACFTPPKSTAPLSWIARLSSKSPAVPPNVVGSGMVLTELTCFSFIMPSGAGLTYRAYWNLEVTFSSGVVLRELLPICPSQAPSNPPDLPSSSSEESVEPLTCRELFPILAGTHPDFKYDDNGNPYILLLDTGTQINIGGFPPIAANVWSEQMIGTITNLLNPPRPNWYLGWEIHTVHHFAQYYELDLIYGPDDYSGDTDRPEWLAPYTPPADGFPAESGTGYAYLNWGVRRAGPHLVIYEKYRGENFLGGPSPGDRFINEIGREVSYNFFAGDSPHVFAHAVHPLDYTSPFDLQAECAQAAALVAFPFVGVHIPGPLQNDPADSITGNSGNYYLVRLQPYGVPAMGGGGDAAAIEYSDRYKEFYERNVALISDFTPLQVAGLRPFITTYQYLVCPNTNFVPPIIKDWTYPLIDSSSQSDGQSFGSDGESASSASSDPQSESSSSVGFSSSSSSSEPCVTQTLTPPDDYNWMLTEFTNPDPTTLHPTATLRVIHRFVFAGQLGDETPLDWGAALVSPKPDVYYEFPDSGGNFSVAYYKSFAVESSPVQSAALADSRAFFAPYVAPFTPFTFDSLNGEEEYYILTNADETDFAGFMLNRLGVDITGMFDGSPLSVVISAVTEVTFGCVGYSPELPSGEVDTDQSSSSSASSASSVSSQSNSSQSSASSDSSSFSSLSSLSSNSSSSTSSVSSASSESTQSTGSSQSSSSSTPSSNSSSSSTTCNTQTLAAVSSTNGHAFRHDPTNPALVDWHHRWRLSPVFLFKFAATYSPSGTPVSFNWASRLPGTNPDGVSFVISEGELFVTWTKNYPVDMSQTYQTAAKAGVDAFFNTLISGSTGSDANGGFTRYQWSSSSIAADREAFMVNTLDLDMSGVSGTSSGTWFNEAKFPVLLWTSTNRFTCSSL